MDIEILRTFCLSLPAVTEDIKWENNLCFSVGAKMFAVAGLDGPFQCSMKVKDEEFEALSGREGFMPAPYMARNNWVLVTDVTRLTKKEWEHYLKQSYELVKARLTKKLKKELGMEGS